MEWPIYRISKVRNFFVSLLTDLYLYILLGVGMTLTDPQIMTKPDLGSSLFGDRNLGEAFLKFPVEHSCTENRWCEWFELRKLQAEDSE